MKGRHRSGLVCVATVVAGLMAAGAASAAPITYAFASGSVTLTASVGGAAVMAPATLPLDGVQVTVDEGMLTLDSFSFTLTDASLTLTTAYAGYDAIHLDFASITASGGTLTLIPPPGYPQEYAYGIGPVAVAGQIDATGSGAPITDAPFALSNPSASGSLFVDSGPGGGTLTLDGITIGALSLPGAGQPLVLKADVRFQGATSAVPEPGALLLYTGGLGVVATILRRRIA
jgi:hypothetical protein